MYSAAFSMLHVVPLVLWFSSACAGAALSSEPISPARITLSSQSREGVELFGYETSQLTSDVLSQLQENEVTAEYARLFTFDNGRDNETGRMLESGECKSFPGEQSWPNDTSWHILDGMSDSALIPTVPIGAPCYKSSGVYNEAECAALIKRFPDPYTHENHPTSIMWPIYQGRTCLPTENPNGTCTLGGYPSYALNVSNVAQIQLAVNFARNQNIRLVVKNTGHCYLGKSSGAGSLSVWTHNLKDIKFLPEYRSGNYSGKALKLGAGVTIREVYLAAHKYKVTALGGICESVGYAGGYVQGGGHTPLSGFYGMAADHALAFEVVTADGHSVTASADSNPDLFWALRGGGGSTFGVVTSVIIAVHPPIQVTLSKFSFNTTAISRETFWAGVRSYLDHLIPFTDAGTYSYFWIYNRNGTFSFEMKPFLAPNHTIDSFNELVAPWFKQLRDLGIPFQPNTTFYTDYYPAYDEGWGRDMLASSVGRTNSMSGNRLFPRSNWEDPAKFNATFTVLRRHSEAGRTFGGYHQAPRNRAGVDNAVSSAFRSVICFLITMVPVPPNATPAQLGQASRDLTSWLEAWRAVAPESEGGGSYLNEANVMEPAWQSSFYGTRYSELLRLKRKWDPKGVFYATTAVGSEEWVVEDGEQGVQTQNGRLCKV